MDLDIGEDIVMVGEGVPRCKTSPTTNTKDRKKLFLRLERGDFGQAAAVTLFAVELRGKKRPHQIASECRANDARAQAEDVHIIVLDALMRGINIVR